MVTVSPTAQENCVHEIVHKVRDCTGSGINGDYRSIVPEVKVLVCMHTYKHAYL